MTRLDALRDELPEFARDIKLNLPAVLSSQTLTPAQRWGIAITAAVTARNGRLRDALIADARREVEESVVEDALAAACLMAMNNVYYRFRHMTGKDSYSGMPARLRMNRLANPLSGKFDFELFCLAASALNGCEMCLRAHEKAVLLGGLSESAVHDAIRIASTVNAAAIALELNTAVPGAAAVA